MQYAGAGPGDDVGRDIFGAFEGEGFAFPGSLRVAGFMHIGHNALHHICESLPNWEGVKELMVQLCRLFNNPGSILAFSETVLVGDMARHKRHFQESARCPDFIDWRWRSLVHCAEWLLRREAVIRSCWNRQAFQTGYAEENTQKKSTGVRLNLDLVSEACASEFFWRYLDMLTNHVGMLGEDLSLWFSSCPCHRDLAGSQAAVSRKLKAYMKDQLTEKEKRSSVLQCPMSGKCAPEVALGRHIAFLRGRRFQGKQALLTALAGVGVAMAQGSVDTIIADFLQGFDKLIAVIELKLDFTQALPFALCGLAACDQDDAKKHGKEFLNSYDQNPRPELHDRVTVAWLDASHENGLRADLRRWCHSERPLADFPALELEVAALRFVPLVEWDAERPHSIMKRAVMGKASKGVRASLSVRLREIRDAMGDPLARERFVKVFDCHSDIFEIISELGLADHSVITQAIRPRAPPNHHPGSHPPHDSSANFGPHV